MSYLVSLRPLIYTSSMLSRLKCIGLWMIIHPWTVCFLAILTYFVFFEFVFALLWINFDRFFRFQYGALLVLRELCYVCYAVGIGQLASRSMAGAILATCIIAVLLWGMWHLQHGAAASDGYVLTPDEEARNLLRQVTYLVLIPLATHCILRNRIPGWRSSTS